MSICRVAAERLSLGIRGNLKKKFELEARREERSPPYPAVKAVAAMLCERAERWAAIREAASEADKGAFISLEVMDVWVSSWDEESELPPPPEPDVHIASQ